MRGTRPPLIEIHRGAIQEAFNKLAGDLRNPQISQGARIRYLRIMTHLSYETGEYPEMLGLARKLSSELKKDPSATIYGRDYLAGALVKNGKSADAHTLLEELQKAIGDEVPIQQVTVNYASAVLALEEGKNEKAVRAFRIVFNALPPNREPNVFYALALLRTGQIAEAMQELQRLQYWPPSEDLFILRTVPGAMLYWPIPAVKTRYWLGLGYEQQGQEHKAVKEYEEFLEIWKDADFKSKEIDDAKARLAKLRNMVTK